MPGQQAQKNRRRGERGVIGPLRERLAHGSVIRAEATVKDAEGGIGLPWIGLDTLARMHRNGSINSVMRLAGERFHDFFRRASLDVALFAIDPARVPAQRGKGFRRSVGEGMRAPANRLCQRSMHSEVCLHLADLVHGLF